MKFPRLSLKKTLLFAMLIAGIMIDAGWWLFWSDDPLIGANVDGFPVRGADVSAHNGYMDFNLMKKEGGIGFILIKATEGAQWQDKMFRHNFRRARQAGMKVGAYHFFRFDVDPELQALNVIATLRGHEPDMPLAIDVEEWTNPSGISPDTIASRVVAMSECLRRRGINTMLYSNKKGYSRIISRIPNQHDIDLWLCSLSSDVPGHRFVLWQYSHRGRLEGVDGKIDLNVFAGDSAGWRTWLSENPFRSFD